MAEALISGAEELLIALQTPSLRNCQGIPALVWGRAGTGKTTFLEGLRRDDFPVVTLIASIHDPTDFSGLPIHANGQVRFAPPEWACRFDGCGQGLLFIDELTTAPPAVQAALLRVVLERQVGGKALDPGVRVAAAANPPDDIVGGWELTPPLANRFVHITWELPGAALAKALQAGFPSAQLPAIDVAAHRDACDYWRALVSAFIRSNPAIAHTRPAEHEYAFASPRTWDFAIRLMASCQLLGCAMRPGTKSTSTVFLNLLRGCVGSAAATALLGYIKNLRLPDPEKVLRGAEQVDVDSLQDDELYVLFCALGTHLQRDEWKKGESLPDSTIRTLDLVGRVAERSRLDAIFVPLRQLVQTQFLQRAIVAARRSGQLDSLRSAIQSHLTGELAEYATLVAR